LQRTASKGVTVLRYRAVFVADRIHR
jgi:hypothetical protein